MSTQFSDKLNHLQSMTTTQNSNIKTPFGIEDILYINGNNNNNNNHSNQENLNKIHANEKNAKSFVKNSDDELKKSFASER